MTRRLVAALLLAMSMLAAGSRAEPPAAGAPGIHNARPTARTNMDERQEIANRVAALAAHVDARRWSELTGLFAGTVRTDYTSLFGGEPQSTTREALVGAWRQLLPGFTRTTHVIGTPHVVVEGATARVTASVAAWHFIHDAALAGQDRWLVGGAYEMVLERHEGVWKIASLTLARAWSEGNQDLPRIAAERSAKAAGS
jgi:hypothetical protein